MLRTSRQADKQTEPNIPPMPTDSRRGPWVSTGMYKLQTKKEHK